MGWFDWGSKGPSARPSQVAASLAPLGSWVRCGPYEVSVAAFEPYVYVGPNPPPEGKELFVALVELQNVHSERVHYAPHIWRLYDSEYFSHSAVSSHYCRQPQLANAYLAPGGRVRGYVTFEVPTGAVPARVSFADYQGVADFAIAPPEPPAPR